MGSVDLKDAFSSIPMFMPHQKIFKFVLAFIGKLHMYAYEVWPINENFHKGSETPPPPLLTLELTILTLLFMSMIICC